MGGIFGILSMKEVSLSDLHWLVTHAEQRGRDSSGLVVSMQTRYEGHRAHFSIRKLLKRVKITGSNLVIGQSQPGSDESTDTPPVLRGGLIAMHSGVIVNDDVLWDSLEASREQKANSEIIPAFISESLAKGKTLEEAGCELLNQAKGIIASVVLIPTIGKILLLSNNGSLYLGQKDNDTVFSSEIYPLKRLGAEKIVQVFDPVVIDAPISISEISLEAHTPAPKTAPELRLDSSEERLLEYRQNDLRRCAKCILPETMPFIEFDAIGVCNYCLNYRPRNQPRNKTELFELVDKYRRPGMNDALVPFSGGRDSCYALHLIVEELGMRPITYTYDWGMITEVGRRNLSRMSADLGVENIVIAADIRKKRANITRNLQAWLKSPDLGMLSILTAGDKHFFRHIETVKKQTGIDLNLWGINPLEVTHFKAGFLGVPPNFVEDRVYSHGAMKQLHYQKLRLGAMTRSPSYFNRSLWDTVSGEYYRSFTKKSDYYHVFDYWRWNENEIDDTLLNQYGWEKAVDTTTTWRIGDSTAAFYNYVYYTLAGFTEHDTFRSNQIREGDISREEALSLVQEENSPRYPNLKRYLDVLGLDFSSVIRTINGAERVYA